MPGVINELAPVRNEPASMPVRWSNAIDDYPIAVSWSPDATLIAVAASGGPITLFDANSGDVHSVLAGHAPGTMSISWNADGTMLASGGQDGCAHIWSVVDGTELAVCQGGSAWVEHTAFNPLGGTKRSNHLLATAAGRTLRIWSAKGVLIREYPEHASTVSAIAWKPGRQELVSASYGTLATWVPSQDSALKSFHWKGSILSIACSPNDKFIATGDQDCTVHFWYTKTGRDLQMAGYPAKVLQLSWDATSRFLATGGSDTVVVWDCQRSPEGSTPLQCEGHEDFITMLAYQHRGSLLASTDATGLTALWHPIASSKPRALFKMPDEAVALSWNSTDDALVVASGSGRFNVLECAS